MLYASSSFKVQLFPFLADRRGFAMGLSKRPVDGNHGILTDSALYCNN
jgi:hypothetical protein